MDLKPNEALTGVPLFILAHGCRAYTVNRKSEDDTRKQHPKGRRAGSARRPATAGWIEKVPSAAAIITLRKDHADRQHH
ncbi:MAG: hypothetical protein EON92_10850 [Burkholderiales bacterium]|nr:MAG: hypothetical protein EON92_10850 [Burkholderiales bacterium]